MDNLNSSQAELGCQAHPQHSGLTVDRGSTPVGLVVALGCVSLCLYALYYGAMGSTVPLIGEELNLSLSWQGLIMTAYGLGYLTAVVAGGYLSDRLGKERVLCFALILVSCGLVAAGASHTYTWILAALLLASSGGGLIEMSVSALVSDQFPSRRSAAMNLLQLAFGLSAVSPLLLNALMHANRTWRLGFIGLGLLGAFLALVMVVLKPNGSAREQQASRDVLATLIRRPRLWAIAVGQATYVCAEGILLTWAVTYLVAVRGLTLSQANGAISVFWVTLVAGRLVCSVLSSRIRSDRLLVVLSCAAALGVGVVLLIPLADWSWIVLGLLGLPYSGIYGTILAYAGDTYGHHSGMVFGFVMASGAMGTLVGPLLIGVLAQATRLDLALGVTVLLLLATASIFQVLGPSNPS